MVTEYFYYRWNQSRLTRYQYIVVLVLIGPFISSLYVSQMFPRKQDYAIVSEQNFQCFLISRSLKKVDFTFVPHGETAAPCNKKL